MNPTEYLRRLGSCRIGRDARRPSKVVGELRAAPAQQAIELCLRIATAGAMRAEHNCRKGVDPIGDVAAQQRRVVA
jgi:hypothetical protein